MAQRPVDNVSQPPGIARTQQPSLVPAGAPAWVTAELIAQTIQTWQRYYEEPLTSGDALAMIMNVALLCDSLHGEQRHEAVRRPGPRQQP